MNDRRVLTSVELDKVLEKISKGYLWKHELRYIRDTFDALLEENAGLRDRLTDEL